MLVARVERIRAGASRRGFAGGDGLDIVFGTGSRGGRGILGVVLAFRGSLLPLLLRGLVLVQVLVKNITSDSMPIRVGQAVVIVLDLRAVLVCNDNGRGVLPAVPVALGVLIKMKQET